MKKLYMKQKVFSLGEKFTVTDANAKVAYSVAGSFFKIPKEFRIFDTEENEIAKITKQPFALLPKFTVEIDGQDVVTLQKKFTFLKARYSISSSAIEIRGDWWDMDFEVLANGKRIAEINKRWISWGDTYEVTILNDDMEQLTIALVIAIDCVKSDEAAASSASN